MIGIFTYDQAYVFVVFMVAVIAIVQIKGQQAQCYCLVMSALYIRNGPDLWMLSTGSLFMVGFTFIGSLATSGRK